jgi:phosphoribosylformylglycinamidine cyclo-ligase
VLLGGETAEMPGFYSEGEYDVAGFIVGIVDRARVIDGHNIKEGDVLLALPSVGLHTNGYSLARKLFFETAGYEPQTELPQLGMSIGAALLQPHASYLPALEGLLDSVIIKGLAHITGGGLTENIPRILPPGTSVIIARDTWPVLPIFKLMQEIGSVADAEMYRTFNMGVGMVIVCAATDAAHIKTHLSERGQTCYEIGRVEAGSGEVNID